MFYHSKKAKKRDYRYEFYPRMMNQTIKIPRISSQNLNLIKKISSITKELENLHLIKYTIIESFDKVLKDNNLDETVPFKQFLDSCIDYKFLKEKTTQINPENIYWAIEIESKQQGEILIKAYHNEEWITFLKLYNFKNLKSKFFLYMALKNWIKDTVKKTSKRRGKIYSLIWEKTQLPNLDLNRIEKLIDEWKHNVIIILKKDHNLEDLFLADIENKIRELEEKLNDIVYKLYNIEAYKSYIEDILEINLPYIPKIRN